MYLFYIYIYKYDNSIVGGEGIWPLILLIRETNQCQTCQLNYKETSYFLTKKNQHVTTERDYFIPEEVKQPQEITNSSILTHDLLSAEGYLQLLQLEARLFAEHLMYLLSQPTCKLLHQAQALA